MSDFSNKTFSTKLIITIGLFSIISGSLPCRGQGPNPGLAPDFAGAEILLEARDSVVDRATHLATCNTADCFLNDIEGSIASESFCDTPPTSVAGAEGSCPAPATAFGDPPPDLGTADAFGCARSAVDRASAIDWQMDDVQKLCVRRTCTGGQPCFDGHARSQDPEDMWSEAGASLELPSASPVTIGDGQDFHLFRQPRIRHDGAGETP